MKIFFDDTYHFLLATVLWDSSKLDKPQISTKCEKLQTDYLHLSSSTLWMHVNKAVVIFPTCSQVYGLYSVFSFQLSSFIFLQ